MVFKIDNPLSSLSNCRKNKPVSKSHLINHRLSFTKLDIPQVAITLGYRYQGLKSLPFLRLGRSQVLLYLFVWIGKNSQFVTHKKLIDLELFRAYHTPALDYLVCGTILPER